ncbi:DUF4649 family protein [Streptococcus thoraltensis]|uniref:DUF4649 family protein n=1 Tax=Streptococcus thoraltensis TaxID=55085 RepID=UPI002A82D683|nr:DUF4649 family protein [Streptococcus thoraltensis]MDY4760949.1 DUF4649 family protein [Streptococcus thoraltensis]
MLIITYLNDVKQEKEISYESYDAYRQAQMACMVGISDHFPVIKVLYKGEEIDYSGNFGNLFYALDKKI